VATLLAMQCWPAYSQSLRRQLRFQRLRYQPRKGRLIAASASLGTVRVTGLTLITAV
jgi:hypothetical protein